jgi:MFS-type transporter involved in bile tolerance (Atg22 family)
VLTLLCSTASGQGINAQLRILGGSIGIAASTAIQASYSRSQLSGILAPEQLANLAGQATTLSATEYAAVRVAYTDALRLMMKVCCAVLAGALVLSSATYSRDRMNLEATMNQRNLEEEQRRAEERQEELSP